MPSGDVQQMAGDKNLPPDEYPVRFDTPSQRERRYLWTSRLLALVASLSMLLNLTLGWALIALFPLKEVRPFLVQFADQGNVVATVRPFMAEMEGKEAMSEKLVREYVNLRHEIVRSNALMEIRWAKGGYIDLMTEAREYERFLQQVSPVFEELRRNDVTQEIKITAANAITPNRLYRVEFESIGRDSKNIEISRQRYVATLEVTYETEIKVTYEQRLINPTAFKVLNYTLSPLASAENARS